MRTLLLAGAAALSLTALPVALNAQSGASASTSASITLTPAQQAAYAAWSAEQRADYDAWVADQQSYFWTLTPRQQEGFFLLTAEQRARVLAMTPAARANAWTSIEAQLAAGANNSATSVAARTGGEVPVRTADQANAATSIPPASTTVTTGASGRTVVATNIPGNLAPPPAASLNKTYPVCTRTLQDNCQNPGEGGAPGRSRALGYWPGEPASEREDRGG